MLLRNDHYEPLITNADPQAATSRRQHVNAILPHLKLRVGDDNQRTCCLKGGGPSTGSASYRTVRADSSYKSLAPPTLRSLAKSSYHSLAAPAPSHRTLAAAPSHRTLAPPTVTPTASLGREARARRQLILDNKVSTKPRLAKLRQADSRATNSSRIPLDDLPLGVAPGELRTRAYADRLERTRKLSRRTHWLCKPSLNTEAPNKQRWSCDICKRTAPYMRLLTWNSYCGSYKDQKVTPQERKAC